MYRRIVKSTAVAYVFALCMVTHSWADPKDSIHDTLDKFHLAASEADGETYFDLLAIDSVFIGTDGSERWTKSKFQQFAEPYFSKGKGWTYHPRNRHIQLSPDANLAWFDEMLDNDSYGECRGTGVLLLTEQGWRITQYHLTIPIPNELAKSFVEQIQAYRNN